MSVARPRLLAIAVALGGSVAAPAGATELHTSSVAATSQGYLYVEFELVSPFEGIYLEALNSGLPTTLNYTIEVWRQRTGWWDRLEGTYEREFRLFRDPLHDVYLAGTLEETQRFSQLDSLLATVCRFHRGSRHGPQYFEKQLFSPDRSYYAVLTATLAPLTVKDLNELDEWLRATLGGRGDESGGGISGLSRTVGGLLMSMTGFGDKQVKARTPSFRPSDLLKAPRPESGAPREPRLAAPDSGRGP